MTTTKRNNSKKKSSKKRSKFKKTLISIASLLLIFGLVACGYGYYLYHHAAEKLSATYKTIGNESKSIEHSEPFTILLLGVDTADSTRTNQWAGNSDTMILMTINPSKHTTTMLSLERDIMVDIGQDSANHREAKLNSAYQTGGVKLAVSTIESLMNTHIDRYLMINMQGLVDLVDAVGGIDVTNHFDFPISIAENEPSYTATINPGLQHINGEQALVYARMRYQDPEGDYGRQKRQREVIKQIMTKVLSFHSISNYDKLLDAVSKNMQTDIALTESSIPSLINYKSAFDKIDSNQLVGEDFTGPDGISYQLVDRSHLLQMQNLIKSSLDEDKVDDLETNAILFNSNGQYLRSSDNSVVNDTSNSINPFKVAKTIN